MIKILNPKTTWTKYLKRKKLKTRVKFFAFFE